MNLNTIPESIEMIDAYETEMWEPCTTHITLTLFTDYYTLYIKYDKVENSIYLRLPASTSGSCNPLKAAFSKLCRRTPFILILMTGLPHYRTINIPDWLLQWMRESRNAGVPTVNLGKIEIRLEDADAIRTLMALLVVDLSKKTNDIPYGIQFYPQSPEQISLYLETITKYNTRFAVKDREIVQAHFRSPSILKLETNADMTVYRNAIMKMVKEYGLPGITRDMITLASDNAFLCDIILHSVSIILHYKAAIKGIVDAHQGLFESQTKLLRQMLAKSLQIGKPVNHPIANLIDDDFNGIHTNHRKTLGDVEHAALEQVRAIVIENAELYVDFAEDALSEIQAESGDEVSELPNETTLTWQIVKSYIMPEVEDQVTMTCGECGLLYFPVASFISS
jgi:hypothetical protein